MAVFLCYALNGKVRTQPMKQWMTGQLQVQSHGWLDERSRVSKEPVELQSRVTPRATSYQDKSQSSKVGLTIFKERIGVGNVFFRDRQSFTSLGGARSSKIAAGGIDRTVCSNRSVKSKFERHPWMIGPKRSSFVGWHVAAMCFEKEKRSTRSFTLPKIQSKWGIG